MSEHIAQLDLDRYVASETDLDEARAVEAHLAGCERCHGYVEEVRAESAALLERQPPQFFARKVIRAASEEREQRRVGRWLWGGLGLAGAAAAVTALLLVFLTHSPLVEGRDGGGPVAAGDAGAEVRWMGDAPVVRVHVQRGEQVLELASGEAPLVGDRLRYEVVLPPGETAFAAVYAVEQGAVVAIVPAPPVDSAIEVSESGLLPGSVDLAPGGGEVQVLLVVESEPFALSEYAAALREALATPGSALPAGVVRELRVDLGEEE